MVIFKVIKKDDMLNSSQTVLINYRACFLIDKWHLNQTIDIFLNNKMDSVANLITKPFVWQNHEL